LSSIPLHVYGLRSTAHYILQQLQFFHTPNNDKEEAHHDKKNIDINTMPPMTKKTQPTLDVEHKDEEDAFEVEFDDSRDDDLDVDDGSGSVDAHTRVGSQSRSYFPSFSFSKTAKWGVLIFAVAGVAGYAGGLVFGDHAKSSTNTATSLNKKFPKSSKTKKPKSSKSEAPSMMPSSSKQTRNLEWEWELPRDMDMEDISEFVEIPRGGESRFERQGYTRERMEARGDGVEY